MSKSTANKTSDITINKWQQKYIDEYYDGKKPRTKIGKLEFDLLGKCKESITVHFPESESGSCPAHSETYTINEDTCNMPEGIISVSVLAANLRFWDFRGYTVEYN